MLLQPKRVKYRKVQKGRIGGIAQRGHELIFGTFGLKALEGGWITSNQIEALRVCFVRAMEREGEVRIRIFPDKSITKKPAEVRMGKGKGNPEYFVAVVRPGRILLEIEGLSYEKAKRAMYLAGNKVSIKTKMVTRRGYTPESN